ncbi:MAG: hypothetical protein IJV14_11800 [Lachnospiraceae bacterium]|nr:hypothetical protein [Lachnospiraceae bacterium]
MVLIRFMSIQEIEKYLAGEVLGNDTPWKVISKSTSEGFCFFPAEPAPESRLHYISGVVDFSVVAEFEVIGPIMLMKGTGRYRDPESDAPKTLYEAFFKPPKMMEVEEYSIRGYSKSTLRLLRMGTVVFGQDHEWHLIWGENKSDL